MQPTSVPGAPVRSTSTPHYRPPALCAGAHHHLIVLAQGDHADAAALVREARALGAAHSTVIAQDAGTETAALAQRLRDALAAATAGVHLYLVGPEQLIWTLHRAAREAGLLAAEISMVQLDDAMRPVYCVHCATTQALPATTLADCPACGVQLFVRDHFSYRLGAYMGVCADVDQPYRKDH